MAYTDYHWIGDRLAVGSSVSEPDDDFPFDSVVSMETWAPPSVGNLVRSGGVDYRWHSIIDGYAWEEHDEIVARFDAAAEQIHDWLSNDRTVLVHCTAGISRSVTTVIWYLMRFEGYSWADAYALVREQREIAFPNPRFEIALRTEAGETIDWKDFDRRIEEHLAIMEAFKLSDSHSQIMEDLERQGTLQKMRQLTR
jgi:hypothetical protein